MKEIEFEEKYSLYFSCITVEMHETCRNTSKTIRVIYVS
jgi:hypothetical protein